jgi:hypothetical protein
VSRALEKRPLLQQRRSDRHGPEGGFIRGETVSCDAFLVNDGWKRARKKGVVCSEGKGSTSSRTTTYSSSDSTSNDDAHSS